MEVFGHRGACGYVAENTLLSIQHALDLEVDGVEFDVRATKDGVPVLIHDDNLMRTAGIDTKVRHATYADLVEELCGKGSLATLGEVLEVIGVRAKINIELKEAAVCLPTAQAIRACVERRTSSHSQLLVTSFDLEAVAEFRGLCTDTPIGLLTKGLPSAEYWEQAKTLNASSANIDVDSVNEEFVRMAHEIDLKVMVYTVNDSASALVLQELGVDAIFSDYPDRVRGKDVSP